MYSRHYDGRDLHFEASGGLVNSSLIMQDRETHTYWSIMKGKATAGPLRGRRLVELPGSEKTRWRDWVMEHPDSRVLSVRGRQYARDSYRDYWRDRRGFRGQSARDPRLRTKEPIFAFEREGHRFAIPHELIEGGHSAKGPGQEFFFLHRPPGSPMFESTKAFVSRSGFVRDGESWTEIETGAVFDPKKARFRGDPVKRLRGLDTFWYNWSLNNPTTKILQ